VDASAARAGYCLVRLAHGGWAVYSSAYDEKMHPGLGPQAEADLLYVRQLNIPGRMRDAGEEFVVWDVGLGAAANAIAVLRATRQVVCPLRLISFDNSSEPLAFALQNTAALGYFLDYATAAAELLGRGQTRFADGAHAVNWQFHLGDFPAEIHRAREFFPAPHAILYDAFSPAKNPSMWTQPVFAALFRALDPARPCSLTTYSRSTLLRVTLLLAGFYVGVGRATGLKEETTVAANTLDLIEQPLDRRWLERAHRSDSAEPLVEEVYRRAPLRAVSWEKLQRHPQFQL
jgi:tRNA U34 5-methylaminomethyl-2-thiouridine-forming methyltransferase MnmC